MCNGSKFGLFLDEASHSIDIAEWQLKLAFRVKLLSDFSELVREDSELFAAGECGASLSLDELKLTRNQEQYAAAAIEHAAIYLLAVAIDTALEGKYGKERLKSNNKDVQNASRIARLIRNAFAHSPFYPKWKIDTDAYRSKWSVPGVIEIDATTLNGLDVSAAHYGGFVSLFRLSKFVKKLISNY